MSDKMESAKALVEKAHDQLAKIEENYNQSLQLKTISTALKIYIKFFLESMRSALDYSAKHLHVSFSNQQGAKTVYFPISKKGATSNDFRSQIGQNIPGLLQARPDIVQMLESFQEFSSTQNEWLPEMATLVNDNKHDDLTPQTRTEYIEKSLTTNTGDTMRWNEGVQFHPKGALVFKPGGKITFGKGGSATFGKQGVSLMGRRVDPLTQTPIVQQGDELKRIIWVGFKFADTDKDVLPFLKECLDGVEKIINQIDGISG